MPSCTKAYSTTQARPHSILVYIDVFKHRPTHGRHFSAAAAAAAAKKKACIRHPPTQAPSHARVPNAHVHATAHSHQRGPIERSGCRRAALTRRTVQRLVPTPTAWPVVSPCLLLGVAAVDELVDVRAKVRADNWSPGSDAHVRTGVARPRVGTGSECTLQSCWLLDLCAVQSVNDGPAARDGAAAIVRSHACRRKSC